MHSIAITAINLNLNNSAFQRWDEDGRQHPYQRSTAQCESSTQIESQHFISSTPINSNHRTFIDQPIASRVQRGTNFNLHQSTVFMLNKYWHCCTNSSIVSDSEPDWAADCTNVGAGIYNAIFTYQPGRFGWLSSHLSVGESILPTSNKPKAKKLRREWKNKTKKNGYSFVVVPGTSENTATWSPMILSGRDGRLSEL